MSDSTALRIPSATSAQASSLSDHLEIGLAPEGSGCNALIGEACQSTGLRMIGITVAAPALARSNERITSMSLDVDAR